jgi:hypothetical protein
VDALLTTGTRLCKLSVEHHEVSPQQDPEHVSWNRFGRAVHTDQELLEDGLVG